MRRRQFIAGLLGSVAATALPVAALAGSSGYRVWVSREPLIFTNSEPVTFEFSVFDGSWVPQSPPTVIPCARWQYDAARKLLAETA